MDSNDRPLFVLGVDPGFASVGVAVVLVTPDSELVVSMGVIRTEKSDKKRAVMSSDDNVRRAREITRELLMWMMPQLTCFGPGSVPHPVSAICAEAMSFPRSSSVAAKMAMTWGVVTALASIPRPMPILQASPQEIKRTLTGRSGASKEEIQDALVSRYPESEAIASFMKSVPRTQHEHGFDALAAVVTCLDSETLRMARKMASR